MKRRISLLWAVASFALSGCISSHLVRDRAQAHTEYSAEQNGLVQVDGKPEYYAVLPLTIAGDVATSPFQFGYFLFTHNGWGTASIHGVPIPLP